MIIATLFRQSNCWLVFRLRLSANTTGKSDVAQQSGDSSIYLVECGVRSMTLPTPSQQAGGRESGTGHFNLQLPWFLGRKEGAFKK